MQAENPQTHLQKKVQTFCVVKDEHGRATEDEKLGSEIVEI